MHHKRSDVIKRATREFKQLDKLLANLSDADWALPVPRSESKDPWTIKDVVAHITHWKADVGRVARGERRPAEERGLGINAGNRLVYERWHDRTPQDVLAWHRQVHQDVLAALKAAPEKWFSGRQHRPKWPNDVDGHPANHRIGDIEQALAGRRKPRRAKK